ncbi:MAG: hypothetical protein ABJA78_05665 [Ferruginibacter sp.]
MSSVVFITGKDEQDINGKQPAAVRFFAHVFSYIFHPLFVPLYISAFLLYVHPAYFAGLSKNEKSIRLFSIGLNTILFPGITVLLLKGLNFIESVFLRTQRDRIIPYIASGTFYFWMFWVTKNQLYPTIMVSFMLGICISAFAALMANIYGKVSMHAIGMGGMLGIFIIIMKSNSMLMTWPLALALLIAGIVCSSRLIVSDHSSKEVYTGLLLGAAAQFAAAFFV